MIVRTEQLPERGFRRYRSRLQSLRARIATREARVWPDSPAPDISRAIMSDDYLRAVFHDAYARLIRLIPDGVEGDVVEVGSGPGIVKTWFPDVMTVDIVERYGPDIVADARCLPIRSESVRGIIMKDALHHIPDVEAFLDEVERCLVPGGVLVLSEPYWGPLASIVYRWLHPEPFDPQAKSWSFDSSDAWDSNQALPWIVFVRDRDRLRSRFPRLSTTGVGVHVGPSYLFSGGVFGRTPIPARLLNSLKKWEDRRGRWLNPVRFEVTLRVEKIVAAPSNARTL